MADEKHKAGRDVPFLNWRYILFTWNDSDEEMDLARKTAVEVGVDRLCWEITDHPENAFSRRFAPGAPDYARIAHEVWDTSGLGNAIPGATPSATIDVRTMLPGLPLFGRPGRPLSVRTRVKNLSARPFPAHGQLTAAGSCAWGLSSARPTAPSSSGTTHGHGCPIDLDAGAQVDVPIEIPAPTEAGRYAIKFDLVCEGIDWFETCGSQTTTRPLWVR